MNAQTLLGHTIPRVEIQLVDRLYVDEVPVPDRPCAMPLHLTCDNVEEGPFPSLCPWALGLSIELGESLSGPSQCFRVRVRVRVWVWVRVRGER